MFRMNFPFIGSFQRGPRFNAEDPLQEVWDHVARYGSGGYLARHLPDKCPPNEWPRILSYTAIRARQAIELRESAKTASILTAPLPLYYAFLNLTRAFVALRTEAIPAPKHGLSFHASDGILRASARVARGTFADYLQASSVLAPTATISLEQCFARIPELCQDLFGTGITGSIVPVQVTASLNVIHLKFDPALISPDDFSGNWRAWFPGLTRTCVPCNEANTLIVADRESCGGDAKVAEFCAEHLLNQLVLTDTPIWFIEKEGPDSVRLPRAAYYFCGMYILSNIVRYQPEMVADTLIRGGASDEAWILARFMRHAQRFFPQLMLMWMRNGPMYL